MTNTNQGLLSWTNENDVEGWKMLISQTGVITFWGSESEPGYNDGNWHHVVINSTGTMLIDNIHVTGTTYVASIAPNAFLGRCVLRKDESIQLLETLRTYNTPDGVDGPQGIRASEGVVGTITAATFEGRSGLAWDLNSQNPRYFDLHNYNQFTGTGGTWFLWFNPFTTASSGTLLYYKHKLAVDLDDSVTFLQYEKVSGTTFRMRLFMYNKTKEVFSGTYNLLNADSGTNWHHVVLTFSPTAMSLYLNGNLEHTFSSGFVNMQLYDQPNNEEAKNNRSIRIGQNELWNRDYIRYTDNTGIDSGTLGYDVPVYHGYTSYTQDGRTGAFSNNNGLYNLNSLVTQSIFNGDSFSVSYWYNASNISDIVNETVTAANLVFRTAFILRESTGDVDRFAIQHIWGNGNHYIKVRLTTPGTNEQGTLEFAVDTNGPIDQDHTTWNHVAVVIGYDGPNYVFKLYRNGVMIQNLGSLNPGSEYTLANTIGGEPDFAVIGGWGSGNFRNFRAAMSDFRAYNRVLTEGEIYNLANDLEIQGADDVYQGYTHNIQFVTQTVNDMDVANLYDPLEVRSFDGNVAKIGLFGDTLHTEHRESMFTQVTQYKTLANKGTMGGFQAKFVVTES